MNIRNNLWKDGKTKCLTMSYDDGTIHDYRLVDIFDKNGIRGSFHLNGSFFESRKDATVKAEDVKELNKNHEVSAHSYTHPTLTELPDYVIMDELLTDRKKLEALCGYTVRGMSYPNGRTDARVADLCAKCGMKYARTTVATSKFALPQDFLFWDSTCHHSANITELFDKLIALPSFALNMPLMYVWGHSYEFNNNNNWEHMERFCEHAGGRDDVWYATNIEVYDYVKASRSIDYGIDYHTAYNPSGISVWITAHGKPVELKPGFNEF